MRRIIAAVLLSTVWTAAVADFEAGLSAAKRGDYVTALREWQPLAEQGDATAQFNLGLMYRKGEGVPKDDRQAVFWYRKAAEQGHASAQFNLGFMYDNGEGVPKDDRQAVFWYRKAADQGYASAQFNLGIMYSNGEGVPEDDRQAVFWFRKAADQGVARAQAKLGLMYRNGEGVPEDDRQAMFWYRKAADRGDAYAQNNLGAMYGNGKGVLKDSVQAYVWYNLAAAQGNEKAKQNRTNIRRRMTPAQIAGAQKLSREFEARIARGGDASALPPAIESPAHPPGPSRDTVRQVQAYLAALGHDPGPADGTLGKRTVAAVRQFQQSLGMTPTGQISEALLRLLQVAASARRESSGVRTIESSGSGFLIDSAGGIVTNHHVIEGCDKITVSLANQSHDAAVQAQDAVNDLALLKAPRAVGKAATFSRSPRANLGEAVTVAGYPLQGVLAQGLNVTGGNASALAGPGDDARLLQITAPVQQGNSGGPLLDAAGNVIGVIVGKLDAIGAARATGDIPQNVNFAIKGAVVRSFLDIHGVSYRRRDSDDERTPREIAERARDFTAAVYCWK